MYTNCLTVQPMFDVNDIEHSNCLILLSEDDIADSSLKISVFLLIPN